MFIEGKRGFAYQLLDHCGLKRCAQIRKRLLGLGDTPFLYVGTDRRFQTRKTHRETSLFSEHGTGHGYSLGVPLFGKPIDKGSGWIPQTQQFSGLVERLAGCIVTRRAEEGVVPKILDKDEQRVTPRNQQPKMRQGRLRHVVGWIEQIGGQQMAFQVIDTDEGQIFRERQGFGGLHSDEERTDQAGTSRDGQRGYVGERKVRFGQRLIEHRNHVFDVFSRSDLGDHASEPSVKGDLGGDDIRQHHQAMFGMARCVDGFHDGTRRFIARGFQRKNFHTRESIKQTRPCVRRRSVPIPAPPSLLAIKRLDCQAMGKACSGLAEEAGEQSV
jgi:hypothetical protein